MRKEESEDACFSILLAQLAFISSAEHKALPLSYPQ